MRNLSLKRIIYLLLTLIFNPLPAETSSFTFPGGKTKAILLSYDDGMESDRRFVELLNKYKLKGTFNLNSGFFGKQVSWLTWKPFYIESTEVKALYEGHEIASHTDNHPDLTSLDLGAVRQTVEQDRKKLVILGGNTVTSFAYPFGKGDERTARRLENLGITNARLITQKGDFGLPQDWLLWKPTAHHSTAGPFIEKFFAQQKQELSLLYIWGHSWELEKNEPGNSWEYMEDLCRKLSGHRDVWYTTTGEFTAWVKSQGGNGL